MTDLGRQLREDRMLRNAARRLVKTDIAHLRGDVAGRSLASRALDRVKDGSAEIADSAIDLARQHRLGLGAGIAVGLAALTGWIFRDRIGELVHDLASELGLDLDHKPNPSATETEHDQP